VSLVRRAVGALLLLGLVGVIGFVGGIGFVGCGGADRPSLDVSAAASLETAFMQYGHDLGIARTRYSFAGSDTLAAQIEQGIRPDVFASADTELPDALFAKGLVEKPVVFIANRLVIAVPSHSKITGLSGLERRGVTISIGTATVPVGAYAQKVLARMPVAARSRLFANVRDREPDVTGIVGKLTEGAADAGLLYATDVAATKGRLRAIALPDRLQPQILYGIAVVKGTAHRAQARAFIGGLLEGAGRADLLGDGFLALPNR
jgi:molybdate transport system substrate-binding protein